MSDGSNLTIQIGGDTGPFKAALGDAVAGAEALNETLKRIAEVSSQAFEKLIGKIGESVQEFAHADTVSRQLSNALQDQGIFTQDLKDKYVDYAEAVSAQTGMSKVQIEQAQTVAQKYLGQIPVTEKLTKAIADLAVQQGISLPAAAEQLGKAIGQGNGMLLRQGLSFSSTATEADRYQQTLDFIAVKAGGAATAISPLTLATNKYHEAIEANNIALGERFEPIATAVLETLTAFLKPTKENSEAMTDLKAGMLAAGVVLTGIGVALPIAAQGLMAVRAATLAFNIELTATKVLLAGLGIGLLIIALVELATHFKQVSATVIAVVHGMVDFVSQSFAGLKQVIEGALHLDTDKIKEGISQIGDAFKSIKDSAVEAWQGAGEATQKGVEVQIASKKKLADKLYGMDQQQNTLSQATKKAENELIMLELNNGSKAQIDLKKKEIAARKQLEKTESAEQAALLKARIDQLLQMQQKYGVAYAAIAKVMNSEEVQGLKQGTADLVQLTQSKNDTLKGIGKAASVAQIVIKTGESAMNIYAGFSAIPFIGQALGIAGAAAAIAFGAEQVGNVLSAAQGGLVTGGIPGRDSVPALLMPGELVVPQSNFNEVVTATANQRQGGDSQGGGSATIQLVFKDDFARIVEAKIIERQRLGISLLKNIS